MVALAVLVTIILSVFMVTGSYRQVSLGWRPIYALLQIGFSVFVVLLAWYHGQPNDFAYFIAFMATCLLLVIVFLLGRKWHQS